MTICTTERNGQKTPYGINGKLLISGNKLMNENNQVCQLKGISTHNLSLYPEYTSEKCISELTDYFGLSVYRLAMYSANADGVNGYADGSAQHKKNLENIILNAVDVCAKLGIYVLVDWHILFDYDPNMHKEAAAEFFSNVCPKLQPYDNVIYEICNEPNKETTWAKVKKYAKEIIPLIRELDPDKIIIVGTPVWSQRVDQAAKSPLPYPNLAYTLHFYADTHRDKLRKRMETAINNGLPVFVSEFGICDASGNGPVNDEQTDIWIDLMNKYHISYILWNLSNKEETSAILNPSCTKTYGFTDDDFSECGKRVRSYM